jgi:hypothetical protein
MFLGLVISTWCSQRQELIRFKHSYRDLIPVEKEPTLAAFRTGWFVEKKSLPLEEIKPSFLCPPPSSLFNTPTKLSQLPSELVISFGKSLPCGYFLNIPYISKLCEMCSALSRFYDTNLKLLIWHTLDRVCPDSFLDAWHNYIQILSELQFKIIQFLTLYRTAVVYLFHKEISAIQYIHTSKHKLSLPSSSDKRET